MGGEGVREGVGVVEGVREGGCECVREGTDTLCFLGFFQNVRDCYFFFSTMFDYCLFFKFFA